MQVDARNTVRSPFSALISQMWQAYTPADVSSREFLIAATIFATVTVNFLLAAVNANVMGLERNHVIFAEVLIVLMGITICLRASNQLMIPWVAVVWLMAVLFIILSLFRQSIEPKYFRDVLIAPVFIMLGLAYAKGNIIRLFIVLQAFVFIVLVFEGLSPDLFSETVKPRQYYVNTREFRVESFWRAESDLFISAWRPKDRFFSFLDVHRLSSVFLEPVSLGNWLVVVMIFLVTMWRELSRGAVLFFVITSLAILVGSDGRFAAITTAIILAASLVALRLPRFSHFFYLPGAIIAAVFVVLYFEPGPGDNILGRLGRSVKLLLSFDLQAILGLDLDLAVRRGGDSGISYIILSQSILGLMIFWISICFLQSTRTRMGVLYLHGTCIYIALSLLISNSMFSLKTAAPLWFLYGYVCVRSYNSQFHNLEDHAAQLEPIVPDSR